MDDIDKVTEALESALYWAKDNVPDPSSHDWVNDAREAITQVRGVDCFDDMEKNMNEELDMNELERLVAMWAKDRGIHEHSTPTAQLLKAMSEMGELADAEVKGDEAEKIDAVGDIMVCLINYARMSGFSIDRALAAAYDEIKDRKGRMVPGGAFVKDE